MNTLKWIHANEKKIPKKNLHKALEIAITNKYENNLDLLVLWNKVTKDDFLGFLDNQMNLTEEKEEEGKPMTKNSMKIRASSESVKKKDDAGSSVVQRLRNQMSHFKNNSMSKISDPDLEAGESETEVLLDGEEIQLDELTPEGQKKKDAVLTAL